MEKNIFILYVVKKNTAIVRMDISSALIENNM